MARRKKDNVDFDVTETENISDSNIPVIPPNVAIVGRPNVGKSALFNAMLNHRLSIVHEASGVTRDRITAPLMINGKYFLLTDTGGLAMLKKQKKDVSMWDSAIREQAEAAIESADLILMVVDVQSGVLPLDREVANLLHESGKKVFLIATKADNDKLIHESQKQEFLSLGFGKPYATSSLHRTGVSDVVYDVVDTLEKGLSPVVEIEKFKIAIVGRPNVGKSSITNKLLGEKRVVVSDIAGTTRDAISNDFQIMFRGEARPAVLVDTAGLRKKAKVDDIIEHFSNLRVESALKKADLVLFVTEGDAMGSTAQDRRIARLICEHAKACIIVVNKWDQCKGQKMKDVMEEMRATLPHLAYAPMVFTCALSGYQFDSLLDQMATVMESLEMNIGTGLLNRTIYDITEKTPPPVIDTSALRIYYATMTGTKPPTFILFVNRIEACAPNYLAFLSRTLRERFGLIGVPVKLELKPRPKKVESIRSETPKIRAKDKKTIEKKARRSAKTVNDRYKPSKERKKAMAVAKNKTAKPKTKSASKS